MAYSIATPGYVRTSIPYAKINLSSILILVWNIDYPWIISIIYNLVFKHDKDNGKCCSRCVESELSLLFLRLSFAK